MLYRLFKSLVLMLNGILPGQCNPKEAGSRNSTFLFGMRTFFFVFVLPIGFSVTVLFGTLPTLSVLSTAKRALPQSVPNEIASGDEVSAVSEAESVEATLLERREMLASASDALKNQMYWSLLFALFLVLLVLKLLYKDLILNFARGNSEKYLAGKTKLAFKLSDDDERLPMLQKQVGMLRYHLGQSRSLLVAIPYENFVADCLFDSVLKSASLALEDTGLPVVNPWLVENTPEYELCAVVEKTLAEHEENVNRFNELVDSCVAENLKEYREREQAVQSGEQRLKRRQEQLREHESQAKVRNSVLDDLSRELEERKKSLVQEENRLVRLKSELEATEQEVESKFTETSMWVQRLDAWSQQVGQEFVDEMKPSIEVQAE